MIGFLKFLLSLLVISSHLNIYPQIPRFSWFNQGIFAVIGFYLLSGYFTSLILEQKYKFNKKYNFKLSKHFILDKFKKIAPLYYLFAFLTFLFLIISKYQTFIFSWQALISNLLIVPLNLFQILKLNLFEEVYYDGIIPAAWYLGTLFQYYLIAPFLYKYKKVKIAAYILSLTIFLFAVFNQIPSIFYGLKFLGGGLLFFFLGDLIYQIQNYSSNLRKKIFIALIYIPFFLLTIFLYFTKTLFQNDINGPIFFGFLILFPIIFFLTNKLPKESKLDSLLSQLSFTIYLNHILVFWFFDSVGIYKQYIFSNSFVKMALVTSTSVILAIFVQKMFFFNSKPKESILSKLFHKIKK